MPPIEEGRRLKGATGKRSKIRSAGWNCVAFTSRKRRSSSEISHRIYEYEHVSKYRQSSSLFTSKYTHEYSTVHVQ